MFFLFAVFSFFLGIIAWIFYNLTIIIICAWIIFLLTIIAFQRIFIKIICFIAILLFAGNIAHNAENTRNIRLNSLEEITEHFEKKVTITGKITKKMFQTDFHKAYRLEISSIETKEKRYIFQEKDNIGIFVNIPKNLTLNPGDIIQFTDKIWPAIEKKWSTVHGFSKYAWFYHIYGKSSPYNFTRLKNAEKSTFQNASEKVKTLIFQWFPEHISALILGITIGNTDLLTENIKKEFKNASLTHILVVSGANIAFLIFIIEFFLKYFPLSKYGKYGIIFSFLFAYGSVVWWEIPVIRATAMGIITYLSMSNAWRINSVNLLLGLAVILSIIEPHSLLYDASFGLSFGATLGILIFHQPIFDFLQKYIKFSSISTLISVTLSATLWSLPALIFHFGAISIFGIFANIFAGGFMGILLFLSTLYIFITPFTPDNITYILGLPVYWLWEIIFLISGFFGNFPLSEIPENIKIPLSNMLCFAGFLSIIIFQEKKILQTK